MAQSRKVRVAVDAMGGDHAPEEIVKGAVLAAQNDDVEITLIGSINILEKELAKCKFSNGLFIPCVEASEVITEDDSPALAIRRKSNYSIAVAAKMVKSGEAEALVSAGPTGATAISAIQFMGMIDGMERPAIIGSLGRFASNTIVVDLGASVDCKPHQFLAFAIAGSVYAKKFLNIANPTVALLSTGPEECKGNDLIRESHTILKNSGLNFIGNIEGSDVLTGKANVIVCDGFVGNVLLKFYESIGGHALEWTGRKLKRYPPLGGMVKLLFNGLFPVSKMSYESDDEGSGILWGIDGVVRIAHGTSQAPHIAHAIASARKAVKAEIVGSLKSDLAEFNQGGKI